MNRPLLLIICDFLLLSLLQFIEFDRDQADAARSVAPAPVTDLYMVRAEDDLMELLTRTLGESADRRQELSQEVEVLQQTVREREARETELTSTLELEREEARRVAEERARLEEERERLEGERQRLEGERDELGRTAEERARLLAERETQVERLRERVELTEDWSRTSQRQLDMLQEEFRRKQEVLDRLLADRTMMEEERSRLESERRELEVRWQVAETEKRAIEDNLGRTREDLERVQEDRDRVFATTERLAEGVQVLGESSREITEEIRDMRTLSAAAVFSRFQNASLDLRWTTERGGLFGTSTREQEVPSLLVSDGDQVYALLHFHRTPLDYNRFNNPPQTLFGQLSVGDDSTPIPEIRVLDADPRLLAIPVPSAWAEPFSDRIIPLARDPLQHQSLVLISRDGEYYGEGELRLRPDARGYLNMPSGLFTRIFGNFAPNRGDWVFNRHGSLVGVMVNSNHAVILDDLSTSQEWSWGDQYNSDTTRNLMRETQRKVRELSSPLR